MLYPIGENLHRLQIEIDHSETISGCSGGTYQKHGWYYFPKGVHITSLANSFCDAIDQLETNYVHAVSDHWFKLGEKIITTLPISLSSEAQKIQRAIQQRLIALKKRDFKEDEDPLTDEDRIKIQNFARKWKNHQVSLRNNKWEESDENVLNEAISKYHDFFRLLLQDGALRNRFFAWVIRDQLSAESFVEFPKTRELIEKLYIGPSIKMTGVDKLKVKVTKLGAKCLTYPLYGKHKGEVYSKPVKIWNQKKIREFPHGYKTTLENIFEEIRQKDKKWANFLITENGIENWSVQHWGILNSKGKIQKNSLTEDWYRKIPVIQRMSVEEACELYGPDVDGNELDGNNFAVVLRASRRRQNLAVIGTHAFFDLCIPDDGEYIVVSPGKFSRILPKSFWEMIKIFGDSVPGIIISHDPSVVHPLREQKYYPAIVDQETFEATANEFRVSIENGRSGNLVFSIFANSCAPWSQKMMNSLLKKMGKDEQNYFRMNILDTEPEGFLKVLLDIVKYCPVWLQPFVTRLILICFYPFRSILVEENGEHRRIRCFGCDNWNELKIDIPARLFQVGSQK